MLRLSQFKLLVVATALALTGLTGASVALATSASGTQNPNLTVTAVLSSNGSNPDLATTGNTVTATAFETNNTTRKETIQVSYTLTYPDGRVFASTKQVILAAGQTQTQSKIYTVGAADPRGTYTYTVAASDANGTSSATANIQVN